MTRPTAVSEAVDQALSLSEAVPMRSMEISSHGDMVVVVTLIGTQSDLSIYQSICQSDASGGWKVSASEPGPGWIEVDKPRGVLVQSYVAEPDAERVRLQSGEESDSFAALDGIALFFDAAWSMTVGDQMQDAQRSPSQIRVANTWYDVAMSNVCMRADFLASKYIEYETTRDAALFWAWEVLNEGIDLHPEEALPVLFMAIERAGNEQVLASIAAGPLVQLIGNGDEHMRSVVRSAAVASHNVQAAISHTWTDL